MTIAALTTSLLALGYQLVPPAAGRSARAPAPSMEARLNNYVLPGPMRPIGNQVCCRTPLEMRRGGRADTCRVRCVGR